MKQEKSFKVKSYKVPDCDKKVERLKELYTRFSSLRENIEKLSSSLESMGIFSKEEIFGLVDKFREAKDVNSLYVLTAYLEHCLYVSSLSEETKYVPVHSGVDFGVSEEDEETSDETAVSDGQTSFEEEFPELSYEDTILREYKEFLAAVRQKAFYKTLSNYYDSYVAETLDMEDRKFLWRLLIANSSLITHLGIQVEGRASAIALYDYYIDGLVSCLNSIIHGADNKDISTAFLYLCSFLGIGADTEEEEPSQEEEDI